VNQKFNNGDIVVVGGDHKSMDDFEMTVGDNEKKKSIFFTHGLSEEAFQAIISLYSSTYNKIGMVASMMSFFKSSGFEKINFAVYYVQFDNSVEFRFHDDEFRLADEYEQFLYHVYGSNALRDSNGY
jgi:hypothetical protein